MPDRSEYELPAHPPAPGPVPDWPLTGEQEADVIASMRGAVTPRTSPRRFRIEHGTDHAEALQTTDGVIVAFWMTSCQVYAWTDVDELREELPAARLTWIDGDPDA